MQLRMTKNTCLVLLHVCIDQQASPWKACSNRLTCMLIAWMTDSHLLGQSTVLCDILGIRVFTFSSWKQKAISELFHWVVRFCNNLSKPACGFVIQTTIFYFRWCFPPPCFQLSETWNYSDGDIFLLCKHQHVFYFWCTWFLPCLSFSSERSVLNSTLPKTYTCRDNMLKFPQEELSVQHPQWSCPPDTVGVGSSLPMHVFQPAVLLSPPRQKSSQDFSPLQNGKMTVSLWTGWDQNIRSIRLGQTIGPSSPTACLSQWHRADHKGKNVYEGPIQTELPSSSLSQQLPAFRGVEVLICGLHPYLSVLIDGPLLHKFIQSLSNLIKLPLQHLVAMSPTC